MNIQGYKEEEVEEMDSVDAIIMSTPLSDDEVEEEPVKMIITTYWSVYELVGKPGDYHLHKIAEQRRKPAHAPKVGIGEVEKGEEVRLAGRLELWRDGRMVYYTSRIVSVS